MNSDHKKSWLKKRRSRRNDVSAAQLLTEIQAGSRDALSRSITLLESTKVADQVLAQEVLKDCLEIKNDQTIRIGITGVPGVGKSSFIEIFGLWLIEQGKQVAILAIDPSSASNSGSILGDKTRMNELSMREEAFIRPSPAGTSLGGVARKTRESIILCEAAGFDVVLVETVGVGQSEGMVHSMVDFFLLLMLSGAGDELQGIKRGIMELADLLVVNKADGDNLTKAKVAARTYKNALHLFPGKENRWVAETAISSSVEKPKMDEIWAVIERFENHTKENGHFLRHRNQQNLHWFKEELTHQLLQLAGQNVDAKKHRKELENQVEKGTVSPFEAADCWIKKWILKNGI
ncbi:MAG: methylmalonyl Co-A mutase-associated GTPase MeaB [Bacteroidetes bacterium]|nr:methylmalonyl Co-A mutase-associated GTPase MeaB [Bacteroidota bacterium]